MVRRQSHEAYALLPNQLTKCDELVAPVTQVLNRQSGGLNGVTHRAMLQDDATRRRPLTYSLTDGLDGRASPIAGVHRPEKDVGIAKLIGQIE
jgi:hypothetical protein